MRKLAASLFVSLVLMVQPINSPALHAGHSSYPPQDAPAREWSKEKPPALGIDEKMLDAFDADLAAGKYALVDSFALFRCGREVYKKKYSHDYAKIYGKEAKTRGPLNAHLTGPYNYFDPAWHPYYHGTDLHTMQSVSKTVTSVILGIAITRGDFKSGLDTRVLHYFNPTKVKNIDERKRRMNLGHVLTMTTGLDWVEDVPYDDPRSDSSLMEATDDWIQYVIDKPMKDEPGTVFNYSSGATELLAYIFQKETGQDIGAYGEKYLFQPLDMKHFWKRTPKGLIDTEGGLYLNDGDLAKIGYLYLHHGMWNGQRIVSESWVQDSLAPAMPGQPGGAYKYGFKWWLLPESQAGAPKYVWMGRGFGGQRLMVFPERNLIAVFTGWEILHDPAPSPDLFSRILPAVSPQSCLAANR